MLENAPLLGRRRRLIGLVEAAAAIEILDLPGTCIVPFDKRIEIAPERRARHARFDVFRVNIAIERITLAVGIQFDERAREHELLQVHAFRRGRRLHVFIFPFAPRVAHACADMSFYEFRRQVEYKADMRGGRVIIADRWFPSSKTCSGCGHKIEAMPLKVREWVCPSCGSVHDRDVNAAINLKNMAASSAVSACGEEGSGRARKRATKPASAKQEPDSKLAA
ncbi:RNA-guided endonuclease InsQ/TnpB family protein [Paraburkholderia atlantica]|uniref:RNA-guided endonuclease InsQ/TnpB family protein n=1 Tax=Paraburkholderia atlantica TaxID=2654982 RepID=UPI0017B517CB|nr:zinc ribbon domain-containing protein [Paraburkholderia atlantica]MBB5420609.1 putative RNA-binding Zn-ribbon protein involved in translation (DUF1610 family) [Paraburkholderia atlantica]